MKRLWAWWLNVELRLRRRQYARAVSDLRCEELAYDERVHAAIKAQWLQSEIAELEWHVEQAAS